MDLKSSATSFLCFCGTLDITFLATCTWLCIPI